MKILLNIFLNIVRALAARQSRPSLTALVEGRPAWTHLGKAFTAVDGTVAAGLKRHLRRLTTVGANGIKKLPVLARPGVAHTASTTAFTLIATIGATGPTALRLAEAARGEELLVVRREGELLPAIHAG